MPATHRAPIPADPTADRICAVAARFVGAPALLISMTADQRVSDGSHGLPEHWSGQRARALSRLITAQVAARGEAFMVWDAADEPSLRQLWTGENRAIAAYAVVPLGTGGEQASGWLAAIDFVPHHWSEAELRRLGQVASIAAEITELRNKLAVASRERLAAREERDGVKRQNVQLRLDSEGRDVLLELSRKLALAPDARGELCKAVTELTDATAVLLWEPSPTGSQLVLTAQYGAELMPLTLALSVGASAEADAFAKVTPCFIATVDSRRRLNLDVLAETRARSFVLEPVIGERGVLGLLEVAWRHEAELVPRSAPDLIRALAIDAAAAIQRANKTEYLATEARTDALTGLPNRRAWDEELPSELARARRLRYPVCVAIADLNHFKRVNDRDGHPAGDHLLRALAVAWQAELRDIDLLARVGGDEFALLLPGCKPRQTVEVAQRLHARTPAPVTASIGVAAWNGSETAIDLVVRADEALYRAKHARKPTVVAAAPETETRPPRR